MTEKKRRKRSLFSPPSKKQNKTKYVEFIFSKNHLWSFLVSLFTQSHRSVLQPFGCACCMRAWYPLVPRRPFWDGVLSAGRCAKSSGRETTRRHPCEDGSRKGRDQGQRLNWRRISTSPAWPRAENHLKQRRQKEQKAKRITSSGCVRPRDPVFSYVDGAWLGVGGLGGEGPRHTEV